MSDTVKNTATVEPSGGGGGVEGATIAVKSTDTGDVLNSATSGSDGTTESLPPATLDNGLPGATN